METTLDIKSVEKKLVDITVTPIPMNANLSRSKADYNIPPRTQISPVITTTHQSGNMRVPSTSTVLDHIPTTVPIAQSSPSSSNSNLSKYAQLLMVIEEMGRDVRPTYSGSRSSAERLKRGIVHARILVRECLLETERSSRN
ncbi:cyclin-dependent kinase 2-associated protein 1-like [Culicoides brevitarsis]|uniref:cyclin-dependent kinase 2-associated protein 1-like n=1 Tax=Culicoides brevitarsis TaxID=469753 RepID=UPI00307BEF6A